MTPWHQGLDHVSQALLDQALDRLEQANAEALPGLLAGTKKGYPHVRKLQLGGKVRLRPLLCTGPLWTCPVLVDGLGLAFPHFLRGSGGQSPPAPRSYGNA